MGKHVLVELPKSSSKVPCFRYEGFGYVAANYTNKTMVIKEQEHLDEEENYSDQVNKLDHDDFQDINEEDKGGFDFV